MAIWEHADYIEPDLVMTKDHVLVCYHDLSLKSNTDVASRAEFASRKRNVTIPDNDGSGRNLDILNDWFIVDFTLAELKTLKLVVNPVGRLNMRLPWFDGMFSIPTFQEYLDLIQDCKNSLNVTIDISLP
jgi:glycerophosphoryl diester phosphodiesterase